MSYTFPGRFLHSPFILFRIFTMLCEEIKSETVPQKVGCSNDTSKFEAIWVKRMVLGTDNEEYLKY